MAFTLLYTSRSGYYSPYYGHPIDYEVIEIIYPQNKHLCLNIADLSPDIPFEQVLWRPASAKKQPKSFYEKIMDIFNG